MVLCFFLLHAVANFGSAAECWWDTCLLCEIPTAIFGQYLAWTASSLRTKGVCLSGSLEKFNASLWLAKRLSGFTKPTSHYWQIPAALWAFPAVGWLSLWEHENHNKMHFYSISKCKTNTIRKMFAHLLCHSFLLCWSSVALSQKTIISSSQRGIFQDLSKLTCHSPQTPLRNACHWWPPVTCEKISFNIQPEDLKYIP